jgi:hypothetical protein
MIDMTMIETDRGKTHGNLFRFLSPDFSVPAAQACGELLRRSCTFTDARR